jgi:peptidoglycan/xylan/chitin deacetylase (PgdA/CDA1 family)
MKKVPVLLLIIFILLNGCTKDDEPESQPESKILVLMYHRITSGEAANLYERSVKDFESDLKYIVEKKIKVICFDDLEKIVKSGKKAENNSVIITFDDGDSSWFTLVKPLLIKYKMKATFFLWTNMIGRDSFLTWKEVESMSHYCNDKGDRPFVFGSHTFSHVYLYQLKTAFGTTDEYNAFLDYELRESKKIIENHTPADVSTLSLPFGDGAEDPEIIAAAKRNGYRFIRTSVWSAIDNHAVNLFALPGLPVLDSTTSGEIGSYFDL